MARSRPRRMQTIATFAQAVDFLGGNIPVARWLETTPENVALMKSRGYAARGYHLHLYLTLRKRGATPAPAVFGLTTWDRVIMPRIRTRSAGAGSHKRRH